MAVETFDSSEDAAEVLKKYISEIEKLRPLMYVVGMG